MPRNTKGNREALAQNMRTNTGSYIRYVESYVKPEKEPNRFINEVLKNKIIPEIEAMLGEIPGPIEYRYKQGFYADEAIKNANDKSATMLTYELVELVGMDLTQ